MSMSVLTFNVWFDPRAFHQRCNAILEIVEKRQPTFVCFQEVLPESENIFRSNSFLKEHYVASTNTIHFYGCLIFAQKDTMPSFFEFELPTLMERTLIVCSAQVHGVGVAVGNCHFESLDAPHLRQKQLAIAQKALKQYPNAILVGDFNFCSQWNFSYMAAVQRELCRPPPVSLPVLPNEELENDCLKRILPHYVDVWPLLRGSKEEKEQELTNSFSVSELHQLDKGFTFDSTVNKMLQNFERMRYDRVLCRSSSSSSTGRIQPTSIELEGTQSCGQDEHGPVWPSDHFALLAEFACKRAQTNEGCILD